MDELVKNNVGLEVLTDTGWSKFDGVLCKGISETATVKLERENLILTLSHELYLSNAKIETRKLRPGMRLITSSGMQRVVSITMNEKVPVYDLLNVEKNHRFYANNILSSNCQFLIADETLINPNTLFALEGIEPVTKMGQVRWYKKPSKGNIYVVGLDPSLGTGGDPAAIQIFEANTTTQIGEWRHNKTDIPNQIKLMVEIIKHIVECTKEPNNIYYSIENNTIGEAALISLNEYGEQNIPGSFISEPGKKRRGFNTNRPSKLAACAKFKTLLESKKMTIHSFGLISELKSFVANGGCYEAKNGETDDLVMASLLVVRIIQQVGSYSYDVDNQMRDHEDAIMPYPFFAVISGR